MSNPPFRILGIEHVGIAIDESDISVTLFRNILNIPNTGTETISDQKVITDIFDTGQGKVELLSALEESSPISQFLEKRGPGMHHIAFRVDDIKAALAYCSQSGIRLIDEVPRRGAEGLFIAFLHPKSTGGVLVELCQHPQD